MRNIESGTLYCGYHVWPPSVVARMALGPPMSSSSPGEGVAPPIQPLSESTKKTVVGTSLWSILVAAQDEPLSVVLSTIPSPPESTPTVHPISGLMKWIALRVGM